MIARTRRWLAAALGLSLMAPQAGWTAAPQAEPPRLGLPPTAPLPSVVPSLNQKVADTIADHLRQSGQLRGYIIDVTFKDGCAELSGSVRDQPQREEALRIVQGVPGVERVVDRLSVASPIQTVAALPPGRLPEPPPAEGVPAPAAPPGAGRVVEPVPVFAAPAPSPYSLNPPRMPPYAWPTYAPYNNYSRVAYPEAYPYKAWPFIGPFYPFPKVPLGWRSVKLEWDDGYWWFSKVGNKYDWWRLRFY